MDVMCVCCLATETPQADEEAVSESLQGGHEAAAAAARAGLRRVPLRRP